MLGHLADFLRRNPTLALCDPRLPYAETYAGADAVAAYLAATKYAPLLEQGPAAGRAATPPAVGD